jgi:ribonucleoside-diphosphate reductase alpha chain
MACIGFSVGVDLAKQHGPAPVLMSADFRTAYAQSPYFDHLMEAVDEAADMRYEDLQRDIEKCGSRFTHHTSIAPAGTISLSFGNNCSNGIEPTFAHEYTRNIIMPGEATKRAVTVRSKELALFRQMFGDDEPLPDFFITADEVTPEQHLWIMAVAQSYVDSSISKTINVPTDIPFEQFKYIYTQAWTLGCKGCTTFRFNPDVFAGVLVRVDDLKKTRYTFTLSDGTEVTASGDEEIVYEGKTHTAANLHDAIKDGYYGRL